MISFSLLHFPPPLAKPCSAHVPHHSVRSIAKETCTSVLLSSYLAHLVLSDNEFLQQRPGCQSAALASLVISSGAPHTSGMPPQQCHLEYSLSYYLALNIFHEQLGISFILNVSFYFLVSTIHYVPPLTNLYPVKYTSIKG